MRHTHSLDLYWELHVYNTHTHTTHTHTHTHHTTPHHTTPHTYTQWGSGALCMCMCMYVFGVSWLLVGWVRLLEFSKVFGVSWLLVGWVRLLGILKGLFLHCQLLFCRGGLPYGTTMWSPCSVYLLKCSNLSRD